MLSENKLCTVSLKQTFSSQVARASLSHYQVLNSEQKNQESTEVISDINNVIYDSVTKVKYLCNVTCDTEPFCHYNEACSAIVYLSEAL